MSPLKPIEFENLSSFVDKFENVPSLSSCVLLPPGGEDIAIPFLSNLQAVGPQHPLCHIFPP